MSENLVGKTLAERYHISELIGTGGMASVYKGECAKLKRDVAIKVLRDSVKNDPTAFSSFKKEAQSAASLNHKNIVAVFDVGEENGIDYMVMEYVKGITLKKYIQQNAPMPWQEVCDFGIQIGQALEAAHSSGIVHRDIKPQNILINEEGELKVTDFGIAKGANAETLMTSSAMGSVHYMSPEQARGGFTDARSDIYSLGVVLFEMLTGTVPFDGDSAVSVALMHIENTAPTVFDINKNVPADLSRIVAKAMAKEQIYRYQTASELVDDLRSVLASQPISTVETPVEENLGDTKKFDVHEVSGGKILPTDDNTDIADEDLKKEKKKKEPKTPEQKKADKNATLLAIGTIILLFVLGIGGYFLLKHGSGEVIVPDFTNMTVDEATKLASEKELKISDDLEYSLSDEIEEGKVISQDPEAKSFTKKTDPIHLVVSIGKSGGNINVPYVKGMGVEEAIKKILDAELTYNLIEEPSNTVEQGKVIRQSPEVGTKVNKDDVVTIHVSTGREGATATQKAKASVAVPDLKGSNQSDAQIELEKKGLKIATVSKKDSSEPSGTIISQSPEAGKVVYEGTAVSVIVSSGNATSTGTAVSTKTATPTKTTAPSDDDSSDDELVTKSYTFEMPDGDGSATVKITIDGDVYYEKQKNYGDTVSIDISGRGKKKIVTYVDGKVKDEKTIEFE